MSSDVAIRAAQLMGGTWEVPTIRKVEIREPEYINKTPTRSDSSTIYIPRISSMNFLSVGDLVDSAAIRTESVVRKEWRQILWVSDHEEYDPEFNTLTLYGHTRIHAFTIWVQE